MTRYPQRSHEWYAEGEHKRCRRCQMLSAWAGAKDTCTGLRLESEHRAIERARQMLTGTKTRKPSDLRREVEAAGVEFELYRGRIRRGWSHEDALRGHVSSSEHDSEQRKGATS